MKYSYMQNMFFKSYDYVRSIAMGGESSMAGIVANVTPTSAKSRQHFSVL